MTRPEAVEALQVAIPRCLGKKIHLSTETAKALGVKAKSITLEEARKIVGDAPPVPEEGDSGDDDDTGGEGSPETGGETKTQKPSRRKAAKPADPPAESGATSDPLG